MFGHLFFSKKKLNIFSMFQHNWTIVVEKKNIYHNYFLKLGQHRLPRSSTRPEVTILTRESPRQLSRPGTSHFINGAEETR